MLNLIRQAQTHPDNTAIISDGQSYTYAQLLHQSDQFAQRLLKGKVDLAEKRVAFMVTPGFDYVRVQWGIWRAGGIAVPLCLTYPPASLDYVLTDTTADIVVASARYTSVLKPLAAQTGSVY